MTAAAMLMISSPLGALAQPSTPTLPPGDRWGPRIIYEPTEQVEVISDLVYAQYEQGRTLKLDLYLPRHRPHHPLPGIIVIRGGSWKQGDKEGFASIASRLAEGGFAAASIEYRTSQEAPFPAAIHDVKAATRWMRTHAHQYGIDDQALGAIGGSAGAHLAILLATSSGISDLEALATPDEPSSQIQAAVGMATPSALTDFVERPVVRDFLAVSPEQHPEAWILASPISHVDQTDPPLLLLHSDADDIVPYQQAIQLTQRYEEAGIRSELGIISGAPHAFWHFPAWFDKTMERSINFFNQELKSTPMPAAKPQNTQVF